MSLTFLDQAGIDALGDGFDEHTPATTLRNAEDRRLKEIARNARVSRVVVNGRDYEGILCVQIDTDFDPGYDLYCVYKDGQVALHDVNLPRRYATFAAFVADRAA